MPGVDEKETGRVEAFSDGVFAIAITLLVLNLKVPTPASLAGRPLAAVLLSQWPAFLGYLTSFATILVMWVNHHIMFTRIRRVDQAFLFLNGFLLLLVTFVPFPTDLIAEHIQSGGEAARTAGLIYAGTYVLLAVAFRSMWLYASRGRRLIAPHIDQERIDEITRQYAPGIPMYLAAMGVAWFSLKACLALCIAFAVFFAFTGAMPNRAPPRT